MNKAAIITICDNNNYGNRLQNYALYKVLKKLGIENSTLWDKSENTLLVKVKFIVKMILSNFNVNIKRGLSFQMFTNTNISNQYNDLDNLEEISDEFSYFIVGSDQIWNYNFGHAKDKDFLKFADYDKTISYAPSFGISEVDSKWQSKISDGINHIKYLSVRENQGAKIIKKLTNRDAQVVLDPTLLLSKEEWYEIEKKPKKMINEKYILTY